MSWRERLARRLVGRYVLLPEDDGVYLVIVENGLTMTVAAKTFEMTSTLDIDPAIFGDDSRQFPKSGRSSTFRGSF